MKRALALFFFLSTAAVPAQAAETLRYVALVHGGTQAGQLVMKRGGDGVVRSDFIFKDQRPRPGTERGI
ncbi:hypothetical protein [Pseudoxanthomonas sp. UTMC 1351]|uniref:hypothetical protein n=1 Tax=Pseudoxanthomonas sp. UTMC 1351 TaxID=2695853 RepID=UPI0034CF729C